jgi:hypothetical protein
VSSCSVLLTRNWLLQLHRINHDAPRPFFYKAQVAFCQSFIQQGIPNPYCTGPNCSPGWVKMDSCSWWTWYSSLSGVSSQFSASSLTSLDQTSSANCQSQALKWTIIRLLNSKQKAPSCLMGYRTFASYSLCRRCCTKHQVEIWKKVLQKRIVIWKCCWKKQQNAAEIWWHLLKFESVVEKDCNLKVLLKTATKYCWNLIKFTEIWWF